MINKVCGIYKIICKKTGSYYYGSAKNIAYRWTTHKCELRHQRHPNCIVQNTWNKYGEDMFQCEIVEILPQEKLLEVEDIYLKEHVGRRKCMNIATRAEAPMTGRKHSEETRQKIRNTNLKVWSDPKLLEEHSKKKIKYIQEHPFSDATRQLMSKAKIAHFSNSEERIKQSERTSRYFADPDNRQHASDIAKKCWSPELRKRQSELTTEYNKLHPDRMKALAAAAHTPSSKQKHLTSIQKHYADPVNRRKASDVSKAYYDEHPEMKQQISDFQKSFWTPERRQQQRERLLAYHKHHKELHHKTD